MIFNLQTCRHHHSSIIQSNLRRAAASYWQQKSFNTCLSLLLLLTHKQRCALRRNIFSGNTCKEVNELAGPHSHTGGLNPDPGSWNWEEDRKQVRAPDRQRCSDLSASRNMRGRQDAGVVQGQPPPLHLRETWAAVQETSARWEVRPRESMCRRIRHYFVLSPLSSA